LRYGIGTSTVVPIVNTSESEENPMRFGNTARLLTLAALVLAGACSGDQTPSKRASGSGGGGGGGGGMTSGGGVSGTSSTGSGGTIGTGGTTGIDPGKDASVIEASSCFTCTPPGGQYCGVIGEGCTPKSIDCGMNCLSGFTCGGSGTPNLCGALPDSGACTPTVCDQGSKGSYCGVVGDNCGGRIDCGMTCRAGLTCGGNGTPNLCGAPPDAGGCTTTCTPPGGT
jgi:hypothetical protein